MKVLKSGKAVDPATWTGSKQYRKCDAELEYEVGDIYYHRHDFEGNPEPNEAYICCPECGAHLDVERPIIRGAF